MDVEDRDANGEESDGPPIPPAIQPNISDYRKSEPVKKTGKAARKILKPPGAPTNRDRRVQFDPLALLLDASLEGELDLVKRVIDKVKIDSFFESRMLKIMVVFVALWRP